MRNIIILLLIMVGICLWGFQTCEQKRSEHLHQNQIAALTGAMHQYRNAFGQQVSERLVFQGRARDLEAVHAADSTELGKLKKLVNKRTSAAMVITSVTADTLHDKPTVINDSTGLCNPTYTGNITDDWGSLRYSVNKDAGVFYPLQKNSFLVSFYNKPAGGIWPFRRYSAYASVVNENPHTITTGMASFQLPPQKANAKVPLIVGACTFVIGLLTGAALN